MDITLFDMLVGSLSSALSYLLLLLSLGSVAVMGASLTLLLYKHDASVYSASLSLGQVYQPRRALRAALVFGALLASLVLILSAAGLRVGGFFTTGLMIAVTSVAVGSCSALLGLGAVRGAAALMQRSRDKQAALLVREQERRRLSDEARRRWLEGADLREESGSAKAGVLKFSQALDKIADLERDISAKLSAAAAGQSEEPPANLEEITQLREQLRNTLELGRTALAAAEMALFRLSCYEPLRRLVRRRPIEALNALGQPGQAPPPEEVIASSMQAIQLYLDEVVGAKALLDALEASELSQVPEDSGRDVLDQVRSELDAIAGVYRDVLRRAEIVELKLKARAGILDAAQAAGSVAGTAQAMGVDDKEFGFLIAEAAKAEAAMTVVVSNTPVSSMEVRALSDALTRSEAALDRRDTASLAEIVRAMKELC